MIPEKIKKLANKVRTEIYGRDVRESIAKSMEVSGETSNEANERSKDTDARQTDVENRFDDQIAGNTDSDEVIDARRPEGGESYPTLRKRLDDEHKEVTAQLAHIHYDVINEGAVGDGITDDTAIIQSILDKMVDGDTIFFPNGIYRTTDTIQIKRSITFNMDGYILADHDKVALQAKNDEPQGNFNSGRENGMRLKVNPNIRRVKNKGYELKESAIGFEIWNCFSGEFNIYRLINNYVGLKLVASKYGDGYAGTSYCKFIIGVIDSFKENIVLHTKNTGWVTQNQFYSGSLTGSFKEDVETIHVHLDNKGSSVINENTFFGIAFEGGFTHAYKMYKSNSNRGVYCRYEMPRLKYLFYLYGVSRFNHFESVYSSDYMRKNLFYDNEDNSYSDTKVVFQDYRLGDIEYYNKYYFIKPRGGTRGTLSEILNRFDAIPESWVGRVVPVTSGRTFQCNRTNNTPFKDGTMDISISIADDILVSSYGDGSLKNIRLSNPPPYSKEIIIKPSLDAGVTTFDILSGKGILDIVNKTNENITPTTSLVKLYFDVFSKKVYITDIL